MLALKNVSFYIIEKRMMLLALNVFSSAEKWKNQDFRKWHNPAGIHPLKTEASGEKFTSSFSLKLKLIFQLLTHNSDFLTTCSTTQHQNCGIIGAITSTQLWDRNFLLILEVPSHPPTQNNVTLKSYITGNMHRFWKYSFPRVLQQ